jgi:hypothetical protein
MFPVAGGGSHGGAARLVRERRRCPHEGDPIASHAAARADQVGAVGVAEERGGHRRPQRGDACVDEETGLALGHYLRDVGPAEGDHRQGMRPGFVHDQRRGLLDADAGMTKTSAADIRLARASANRS